jgi:quercetin dioxygenase-like cupin family protein
MIIPQMTASVMRAGDSDGGIVWNILGQTYRPLQHCEASFAFDTLFPPGTFVPPHIHPTQDEFIRVLDGRFELVLDGDIQHAVAGDLIRLPRGIAHGIFNKSETPVRALFWVAPALRLFELFSQLHNLADPAEVVRLAALHDVEFLPPPAGA